MPATALRTSWLRRRDGGRLMGCHRAGQTAVFRMQDRIETLHTRNVKQDGEREKRRESPQRYARVRGRGEQVVGMFSATRCGAVPGWLSGLGPPFVGSRRCGRRRRRGLNGSGLRCGGLLRGQRCKTSRKAAKLQSCCKGGSVDSIGRRTEQRSPEAPFRRLVGSSAGF